MIGTDDMRTLEDTGQARDAAILAPAPDSLEYVDTAMRRRAAEYQGPAIPYDTSLGSVVWWQQVIALVARA